MIPYFSFREINLGLISIQIWGIFVVIGFLFALVFSLNIAKKNQISEEYIWDIMLLSLFAMIIGSKIFYLIFNFNEFKSIKEVFNFSNIGFSIFGGLFLATISLYIYVKKKKINIYKVVNILIPGSILAIIIVRIGCFLVYDHVGKITSLPWGRLYVDQTIRHPLSLYYIINAIVMLFLICYFKRRHLEKGILVFIFISYYAISRFFLEFLRCYDLTICDERYYNLTYNQWFLILTIPFILYLLRNRINFCKLKN